jgi:hypothetical protein
MRIFRITYTDKSTGETRRCNVFYIGFRDLQGKSRLNLAMRNWPFMMP